MPVVELRQSQKETPGWRARLELQLGRVAGRTALTRRSHHGPLLVQRPFHPEAAGTAHVYVLHPPGGVAGGDRLEISLEDRAGGSALINTPAAPKPYPTAGERGHA